MGHSGCRPRSAPARQKQHLACLALAAPVTLSLPAGHPGFLAICEPARAHPTPSALSLAILCLESSSRPMSTPLPKARPPLLPPDVASASLFWPPPSHCSSPTAASFYTAVSLWAPSAGEGLALTREGLLAHGGRWAPAEGLAG